MNRIDKHSTAINLLIFMISFLLLLGIGIYKFTTKKETIAENSPSETVEKKVKKKPSKSKNTTVLPSENSESESYNPELEIEESREEAETEVEPEPEIEEALPVEKKEVTAIYIPLTRSLFRKPDLSEEWFMNRPRITPAQREQLRIDEIKTDIVMKNIPSDDLIPGKLYYLGENGRLESFIYIEPKGKIHEYLVSFDSKGNPIDWIEIGLITPEKERIKHAGLSTDKLSLTELQPAKKDGKKEEIITEYIITLQLKFKKGKTFTKLR
jgi:hypothetical protein